MLRAPGLYRWHAGGVDAAWDDGLREMMEAHGLMVAEEAVVGKLLGDLGSDAR